MSNLLGRILTYSEGSHPQLPSLRGLLVPILLIELIKAVYLARGLLEELYHIYYAKGDEGKASRLLSQWYFQYFVPDNYNDYLSL